MRLKRSAAAWLLASAVCGGLAWLVSIAPSDDPIGTGLVIMGVWGFGMGAAICLAGFIYKLLR